MYPLFVVNFSFLGSIYVGQVQGHHISKHHCLLLYGKTFPKLNTVAVCFIWSVRAAPIDKSLLFDGGYCAKASSQKISLCCLNCSINVKQYSFFPGTRTCVLQRASTQVFDFQRQFSSQSKIAQINSRIWGLIFLLIGLQYCNQPQAELRRPTVKGGGVNSHGSGLLLPGSQTLPPVWAKPLSSSRCVFI